MSIELTEENKRLNFKVGTVQAKISAAHYETNFSLSQTLVAMKTTQARYSNIQSEIAILEEKIEERKDDRTLLRVVS
jgi:hypothetical protein